MLYILRGLQDTAGNNLFKWTIPTDLIGDFKILVSTANVNYNDESDYLLEYFHQMAWYWFYPNWVKKRLQRTSYSYFLETGLHRRRKIYYKKRDRIEKKLLPNDLVLGKLL
jgi:hypothetical protein